MIANLAALLASFLAAQPDGADGLIGPARFCGYSPIIDLRVGERIVTFSGAMHSGGFRWHGAFGALDVEGIGWASRPRGAMQSRPTSRGHARFANEGKRADMWWQSGTGVKARPISLHHAP